MKPLDLFYLIGTVFSPLYSAAMRMRWLLYEKGVFSSVQLPVPVISVGNLTMGGTGKTPTVYFICRLLQKHGFKPAIISRGYGGKGSAAVNIVSNGNEVLLDAEMAGDEPFMLASSLPGVPVLTGRKRVAPCRQAVKEFGSTILVLDDGYQHLAVKRDINIALFNANTLDGNGRVFPGGELREPISALCRSDMILITGVSDKYLENISRFCIQKLNPHSSSPVFYSSLAAKGIRSENGESVLDADKKRKWLAFSGIAHPQRFISTLEKTGIIPAKSLFFHDHAKYTEARLREIRTHAQKYQATQCITTEKDIGKIPPGSLGIPLYYLRVETVPQEEFSTALLSHPAIHPHLK